MSETTNLEVVAQHGGRVQGTQDALPEPALRAAPGGADDVLGQGRVFCQRKHRAVTSKPHCLQPHFVHFPDERGAQRVLGLSRWRWRFAGKARPASPGRDDSGFRLRCPSPAAPSGPASCAPSGGSPCPVHPGRSGSHPPSRVRVSTALHSRMCWLGSGELTRTPIWAPGPHPSEAASCLLLTRLSGTCSVPAAPSSSTRHPRVSQGFRPASHRSPPCSCPSPKPARQNTNSGLVCPQRRAGPSCPQMRGPWGLTARAGALSTSCPMSRPQGGGGRKWEGAAGPEEAR